MTTGHVFMAMSLDGFVAREDHRIDWLTKQKTDGEEHGYAEFESSVDGIVMGSGSFRNVLSFGQWPYKKPVVVMSHSMTPDDIPAELRENVELSALDAPSLMENLKDRGWSRAYVDGGKVVQSFVRQHLIDDFTITLVPILIGSGKRLFGVLDADIDLELIGSKAFDSGLLQTRYRVASSR